MKEIHAALDLPREFRVEGQGRLPSRFAVTDLATESVGAVGSAIASLAESLGLGTALPITVNQRLASFWFQLTIHPNGWELPPVWDAIAGDYQAKDGWIKLHTNLPHHREAACRALGVSAERELVSVAISDWSKDELEAAIVAEGGVAAAMRSREEWQSHPQGIAVANEPLIAWGEQIFPTNRKWAATAARPLQGLKVLDLTRVLAGPVATRTLAGYGAEVLRLDPPGWDEGVVVPEISLGKKCAYLNLKTIEGRQAFECLLTEADILIHGYRPGALDQLVGDEKKRQDIAPGLIEVCLDAYGWTGPWAGRRGFDSLVQMSSGIAHAGMGWARAEKPTPLPVQALDFATGHLMAAAAIRSLNDRAKDASVRSARLSLARTAALLSAYEQEGEDNPLTNPEADDISPETEQTPWGPAQRTRSPVKVGDIQQSWNSPACAFGSSKARWAGN